MSTLYYCNPLQTFLLGVLTGATLVGGAWLIVTG